MNAFANDGLLEISRWLWDYFLLTTVLLAVVLFIGKFVSQLLIAWPFIGRQRRGSWLLALLCAVPDWSVVPCPLRANESTARWTERLQPLAGPSIETEILPPQPLLFEPPVFMDEPTVAATGVVPPKSLPSITVSYHSIPSLPAQSFYHCGWRWGPGKYDDYARKLEAHRQNWRIY